MLVAIPMFGKDVSPRFGFAEEFLVADISDGNVTRERRIVVNGAGCHRRLSKLRGLGVELLLCGGFNRRFEPLAQTMGIEVVTGLAGDVKMLLSLLARGEELPDWCGCRSRTSRDRDRPDLRGKRRWNN